jgi:UDP:flavonoid glycosyltransferase YjiC (YdhE family)
VRLLHAGAGVRVKPGAPPERIAAAVNEVLTSGDHVRNARRLAAAMATELREDRAADAIEALVPAPAGAPVGVG